MIQKYRKSAFLHIYTYYYTQSQHAARCQDYADAGMLYTIATLYYRSSAGAYYV